MVKMHELTVSVDSIGCKIRIMKDVTLDTTSLPKLHDAMMTTNR